MRSSWTVIPMARNPSISHGPPGPGRTHLRRAGELHRSGRLPQRGKDGSGPANVPSHRGAEAGRLFYYENNNKKLFDRLAKDSSGAELDAEAIRTYLLEEAAKTGNMTEAARIRGLSDDALRRENTGSHVFLSLYGKVMDAMEDFHITLEAQ